MPSYSPNKFTVAILADIHGNQDALDAVLADLANRSYNVLAIAGDLVMNGPHPAETLATVRALNVPTIVGNTDRDVVEADSNDGIAGWTRDQLGDDDIAYLQALPLTHRLTPPGGVSPEDDLLVVHATPTSAYDVLTLEPNPLGTTFTSTTPEAQAIEMLGEQRANLIVYGHIHYASSGIMDGQRIVSIGSVGFPFDGDRRAAYALLRWDGTAWQVAHCRVAYDHERVVEAIYRSGQPFPETYAQRLREANWIPQPRR